MANEGKNELITLFKLLGVKEASTQVTLFVEVFKRLNTVNLNIIEKEIENIARSIGVSTLQAKNLIAQLRQAKVNAAEGNYADRGISNVKDLNKELRSASKKAYIEIDPTEVERQLQVAFAKAKPPAIPIKLDEQGVEGQRQRIIQQVRAISDPSARLKAASQVLASLKQQTEALISQEKSEKRKNELAKDYVRFVSQASRNFNLSALKPGKQISEKELSKLKQYVALETDLARQTERTTAEAARQEAITKRNSIAQAEHSDKIGIAIGKLIRYRVAFFVMRGAIDAVRDSLRSFIEVQYKLAELSIVIDRQKDSIEEYEKAGFKFAQTFGGSVSDVISVMKVWAQTGLDQNAVFKATEATLVGMNALGGTAQEVTEALTAAIFTYGVQVEDLTQVISKWLAVQREFPISAQDLANSLKVVGAAAQVVGVELDDLSGYVAAIGSATRKSGTAVGQSIKTMFARLPRKEVIGAFEGLDVAILKNALDLRDLDNVLFDLSKKWDELDSIQKANLAVTFGGIRRYSDFIALMDNFEIKLAATMIAQKAQNEALEANQIILNTFKKDWERTTAVMNEFSVAVARILTGPLSQGVSVLKDIFEGFNKTGSNAAKNIAKFITFGSTVTVVFIALKSLSFIVKVVATYLIGLVKNSKLAVVGLQATRTAGFEASSGLNAVGTAATFASRAMAAINVAIGVVSIALAIWAALSLKASASQKTLSTAVGDFGDATKTTVEDMDDSIQALESEIQFFDSLPSKFKKIAQTISKFGIDSQEGLESLEKYNTLLDIMPTGEVSEKAYQLSKAWKDNKTQLDELDSAITSHINKLRDQKDELVELRKEEVESIVSRKRAQQLELDAQKKQLEDLKGTKFTKPVVIPVDIEVKTKTPARRKAFNADDVRTTVENSYKTSMKDVFSVLKDDIVDGAMDNLNRDLGKFKVGAKDAIVNFIDYVNSVARVTPGIESNIFNTEDADAQIKLFDDILTKAKNNLGLGDIYKDYTKEQREDLALEFDRLMIFQIQKVNEYFSVNDRLDEQIKSKIKGRGTLETEISKLLQPTTTKDTQLFIGQAPGSELISASENLRKSLLDFKEAALEYNNTLDTVKFGEFKFEPDFNVDKAEKFVNDINSQMESLNGVIIKNEEDAKTLKEMLAFINKNMGELFEETTGKIVEGKSGLEELDKFLRPDQQYLSQYYKGQEAPLLEIDKGAKSLEQDLKQLRILYKALLTLLEKGDAVRTFQARQSAEAQHFFFEQNKTREYEHQINLLNYQAQIMSAFPNYQKQYNFAVKEALKLSNEMTKIIAKDIPDDSKKQLALIKAEEDSYESIVKLLEEQRKARIDKIVKNAADNAEILKDALADAFDNIPDTLVEGAESRRDLAEELREAEFELQEARAEGDNQAIADAQYRVDLAKKEMDEYKAGWYEVKTIIGGLIQDLGSTVWTKISEQFAEDIANITVGGKTLGESIGDSITEATSIFVDDWRTVVSQINEDHERRLDLIFKDHVARLAVLYKVDPFTGCSSTFLFTIERIGNKRDPNTVPSEERSSTDIAEAIHKGAYDGVYEGTRDSQDSFIGPPEAPAKELTEWERLIKRGALIIGNTITSSIFASKGKTAVAGSTLGGLFGTQAGEKLFGEAGGLLGSLAGPLGGLAGGLLGGVLGGLFDNGPDPQKPLVKAITDNTDAIRENTLSLKQLDKSIFNAPTTFVSPSVGEMNRNITINVNGTTDAQTIAKAVAKIISSSYDLDRSSYSSRGY